MCHLGLASPPDRAPRDRLPKSQPRPADHFPLGAEEGVALQILAVLALGDVGEHLAVHLVRCAVGDPERQVGSVTRSPHGGLTTSRAPRRTSLLSFRQLALASGPGILGYLRGKARGVLVAGDNPG